ncbi:DNA repair protein RAD51 homolog 2 isoform X2 [Brachypodium distachyon]|uniref:DNA repair protein RAD51 homolog 2 isoform X2 n=1 Tax=Brachypodium distachyon TaxID=15368 RepID=UPI0005300999|nr:DNA repair protein RAD51 homolog 2 isoform X2 [Brachypodium distachyon]|eukprot:XP_014754791.1 DNA repair protein RAD51 homolog 2 isoform X2 [Brachypodium distachyon]
MANKLVSEMQLPPNLAHLLAARRLTTAKDVLSLPEVELMCLLDAGIAVARAAVSHVSEVACPPCQTALALLEERVRLGGGGRLATTLRGLDEALGGGIPVGKLTEVVGPSGIGKTQFCLKLALLATLPECYGGLNGRVVYIDTESKFSSRRMIEIGQKSIPQIFRQEGLAQKMTGRILVMRPTSLSDFTKRENERGASDRTQHPLRWALSFLKSIAEFSRIPVIVTNQVRSQSKDDGYHYLFEVKKKGDSHGTERFESHLVAALGIQWAHAVTIRLVFESHSGHRFIKVAKSPMSPAVEFPFIVESSGITLLSDEGIDVSGPEITSIRLQGQNILGL